ncbi:MAG: FABP family protein [Actinomycetota bacterium]|nr:FABP family protein [Actinomycetota bacterium]
MDDERPQPDLGTLQRLLGTWQGQGTGHYPTIDDFAYVERVTFEHLGKPFLVYTQRTRHRDDGRPLHAESGFLRHGQPGRVELLIAQPTGIVEVYEGPYDGTVMDIRATTIGLAATAKPVRSVRRRFHVDGELLSYDVWMAHGDTPETHHLHAELRRP